MSTFIATGEFKSKEEAARAMVHQSKEFIPNPANVERYKYLYEHVYIKMYPKLKGIYKEIKEFDDKLEC